MSQKLDGFIVDTGANILGRFSRSDNPAAPPKLIISPYESGKIEARIDIQNGKLIVKSLGELTVVHPLYKEVLMKDYGIEFIDYGCVSTSDFSQYVRAYNEVSNAAIESRYGGEFLDKVFDRAEREYTRKNKPR